jgi:hypothetical protein
VGEFTSALSFSCHSIPWPATPSLRLSTADSGLLAAQNEVDYDQVPSIPEVNEAFPLADAVGLASRTRQAWRRNS